MIRGHFYKESPGVTKNSNDHTTVDISKSSQKLNILSQAHDEFTVSTKIALFRDSLKEDLYSALSSFDNSYIPGVPVCYRMKC